MRLRPHVRLGPYELESAMGEGGLGDVWKARDTTNGRLVALRILPSPPAGDPFRFARFEDDVSKLITLRHPNVAAVYALIEADGVRALACEWVAGDSLATRLAAGPIPVAETIRIIAQVANGLAAAHERDLVHGDIKPCNITLHPDGTVKVTDLGLVEIYDPAVLMPPSDVRPAPSARLSGAITGTAAYMSPERIAGQAADSRADVWAFGCVLYEMLTGKPTFGGDDLVDTMARVTRAEPEWALIPPATPASVFVVLRRCLEKDPLQRFHRLTNVLAPIRKWIGEEGALHPFLLRQSRLRRLTKQVTPLTLRASGRVPFRFDPEAEARVDDLFARVERMLGKAQVRHQGALKAYMRAIRHRLREDVRGQGHDPREGFTATARYPEALKELSERERGILESRIEEGATYDDIASRFSFPTAGAARRSIRRAVTRLVEAMTRPKRD